MFSALVDELSDWSVFTESLRQYVENLSVNSVILTLMTVFMILGVVDKIQGNKRGYGAAFDEGFHAMGPLALAIVGAAAAAPVLSMVLQPFIGPLYELVGSSPAIFATTLLAADMGGYPLALELAGEDMVMGQFAGVIVGCTMGVILLFDIPVALTLIKKEDQPILACAVLVALIAIPIGCLAGGIVMNLLTPYSMDLLTMVLALLPVILVAAVLTAALWCKPAAVMTGFSKFGTFVTGMIAVFVAIAVFQYETGIRFPLFHKMVDAGAGGVSPLIDSILIIGNIAFVLIGAFPMVEWIKRHFGGMLAKAGGMLGMDETAAAGVVASLANNIPAFQMMKDMNPRGKLMNAAFACTGAFVFGDHLGFVAGVSAEMIVPMIAAKLACGICALLLANVLSAQLLAKAEKVSGESAK